MYTVTRLERGWGGHFICADKCRFRRNTLLECNETDVKLVVSTVGLFLPTGAKEFDRVGHNRYFETMVFHVDRSESRYKDIDVSKEVHGFQSPWYISELDADDRANDMHEKIVEELMQKLAQGEKFVVEDNNLVPDDHM